jgi:hypothetical protein
MAEAAKRQATWEETNPRFAHHIPPTTAQDGLSSTVGPYASTPEGCSSEIDSVVPLKSRHKINFSRDANTKFRAKGPGQARNMDRNMSFHDANADSDLSDALLSVAAMLRGEAPRLRER